MDWQVCEEFAGGGGVFDGWDQYGYWGVEEGAINEEDQWNSNVCLISNNILNHWEIFTYGYLEDFECFYIKVARFLAVF